jgi:protein disulfide-isomerase
MRFLSTVLLTTCFMACSFCCAEENTPPSSESPLLPWTTDFQQALKLAKSQSRPIYLYFSGSTWCIWCKKMEKELHNQDGFRQKMVGKFLFVHVDLPAGSAPNEETKALLETYHVKGVPTALVLSPDGEELARFRYREIPPEEYADIVIEAAGKSAPVLEDLP